MQQGKLEHVNVTVTDPQQTAKMLCNLFDWKIRWQGASKLGGTTVHVGTEAEYIAVYSRGNVSGAESAADTTRGGLNHIGVVVEDLKAAQRRIEAAGFHPHSHGDYEPGQRFYFNDHDDIEFEIVSYS